MTSLQQAQQPTIRKETESQEILQKESLQEELILFNRICSIESMMKTLETRHDMAKKACVSCLNYFRKSSLEKFQGKQETLQDNNGLYVAN